jgi:hypothetical protein
MRANGNLDDEAVIRQLPIVAEEVRRRLALGVPKGIDRDELTSVGHLALVRACAKGVYATRLAVRGALQNRVKHQFKRNQVSGEMPADVTTGGVNDLGVWGLVDTLPPRQKEALNWVYYHGLSETAAATEMSCSQQAVSCLLASAKSALRVLLERESIVNRKSP